MSAITLVEIAKTTNTKHFVIGTHICKIDTDRLYVLQNGQWEEVRDGLLANKIFTMGILADSLYYSEINSNYTVVYKGTFVDGKFDRRIQLNTMGPCVREYDTETIYNLAKDNLKVWKKNASGEFRIDCSKNFTRQRNGREMSMYNSFAYRERLVWLMWKQQLKGIKKVLTFLSWTVETGEWMENETDIVNTDGRDFVDCNEWLPLANDNFAIIVNNHILLEVNIFTLCCRKYRLQGWVFNRLVGFSDNKLVIMIRENKNVCFLATCDIPPDYQDINNTPNVKVAKLPSAQEASGTGVPGLARNAPKTKTRRFESASALQDMSKHTATAARGGRGGQGYKGRRSEENRIPNVNGQEDEVTTRLREEVENLKFEKEMMQSESNKKIQMYQEENARLVKLLDEKDKLLTSVRNGLSKVPVVRR